MKTNIYIYMIISYAFFLAWEMIGPKFIEKIETHILLSVLFF